MSADVVELKSGRLDKQGYADYLDMSVSWIEKRMQEGMPYEKIGTRTKIQPADAEAWLVENGWIERRGEAA